MALQKNYSCFSLLFCCNNYADNTIEQGVKVSMLCRFSRQVWSERSILMKIGDKGSSRDLLNGWVVMIGYLKFENGQEYIDK